LRNAKSKMIAIPKKSRKNSKKNVEVSEPIPIPVPTPTIIEEKKPSYRQKLIQRIGLEAVREKEKLSRLATKERKAQAIPVS
jgi:hypothetical protein